jgi:two-component system phosphate regulon response regulator OmpR
MQFIATIATTMKKILLIDDDAELRQLLATYLGRHGFDTLLLPDTRQLDAFLERYQPQLLVLDLMLPGEDGLAACRRLRARGETRPVIMLTARDEPVDRVIGLEMGADDYLGKPFDPRELVARIEAVLRRGSAPLVAPDPEGGVTRFGEWLFDRAARQLSRKDQVVTLTSGEFALLNTLVANARQPMKRERLLELTRGDASESFDRAIDVQIHRLRRLIETDPAHPRYLQTVWGIGYVFVPDALATPLQNETLPRLAGRTHGAAGDCRHRRRGDSPPSRCSGTSAAARTSIRRCN